MMRVRRAVAIAASTAVIAGCGVPLGFPESAPDSWVPSPSPSPVAGEWGDGPYGFTDLERASFRVTNIGCGSFGTGSAFAIDDHTLVTNRHVVTDFSELWVTDFEGRVLTVSSVRVTTTADLALLTIVESAPSTLRVSEVDPELWDYVTVAGYPNGDSLTLTTGWIDGVVEDTLDHAGTVFHTSADGAPGSSGSAGVSQDGVVIGILYAGIDATGDVLLVPVSRLNAILSDASLLTEATPGCDL